MIKHNFEEKFKLIETHISKITYLNEVVKDFMDEYDYISITPNHITPNIPNDKVFPIFCYFIKHNIVDGYLIRGYVCNALIIKFKTSIAPKIINIIYTLYKNSISLEV
jgi:hypothetical protein